MPCSEACHIRVPQAFADASIPRREVALEPTGLPYACIHPYLAFLAIDLNVNFQLLLILVPFHGRFRALVFNISNEITIHCIKLTRICSLGYLRCSLGPKLLVELLGLSFSVLLKEGSDLPVEGAVIVAFFFFFFFLFIHV